MNSHFVSIDTETLGLGPKAPIIEVGAVIQDWVTPYKDPPVFHCYVRPSDEAYNNCEPYAMSMHQTILRRIATQEQPYTYCRPGQMAAYFGEWLVHHTQCFHPSERGPKKILVAGKNYAHFDWPRLQENFPGWDEHVPTKHRVLDPGNLFWQPLTDEFPPDLKTCMTRAGLDGEVPHTALEDAQLVAQLIRVAVQNRTIPYQYLP